MGERSWTLRWKVLRPEMIRLVQPLQLKPSPHVIGIVRTPRAEEGLFEKELTNILNYNDQIDRSKNYKMQLARLEM